MLSWFSMGGHAWFVWSAYLLTVAILLLNVVLPVCSLRKFLAKISARTVPPQSKKHS